MPQPILETSVFAAAPETAVSRSVLLRVALLTPAVLLVHGFHPFADDAGIYVAGIRKLVNPRLYQPDAPFVLANTHLSVFAHLLAAVVRVCHLPLSLVLLGTHLFSIFVFLLACWMVASRLFARPVERWSAVLLAAACFTLPAAGTALTLMDPYVTSRSFSTPLSLFALAAAMDRRWVLSVFLLLLTGFMHPLMSVYAAALVLLYVLMETGRPRAALVTAAGGVVAAGALTILVRHVPVSPAYVQAVHSQVRSFLFPRQWKWYEDLGLFAPLALYALVARRSPAGSRMRRLCFSCLVLGAACALAAFLFIPSAGFRFAGPYLLVRLQLLRAFHLLYLLGTLLLGGWLAARLAPRRAGRWLLVILPAAAAVGMYATQRGTYPLSAHIEWPGAAAHNPWVQAYRWIRRNTPTDAIFAANPDLVSVDGVDMQGFRATAERSLLADDKDQGVAAVMDPALASQWATQRNAQMGVDQMNDVERIARLKPLGATWLLLRADAATGFSCPYRNTAAKVCRMP